MGITGPEDKESINLNDFLAAGSNVYNLPFTSNCSPLCFTLSQAARFGNKSFFDTCIWLAEVLDLKYLTKIDAVRGFAKDYWYLVSPLEIK